MDKYWNELIFNVCKGSPAEMRELKKFEVFDFFDYINNKFNGE